MRSSQVVTLLHTRFVHNHRVLGFFYVFRFCKRRLKVLAFDNWRGFSLDPCPNTMRRR